jgi:hypothetical protein
MHYHTGGILLFLVFMLIGGIALALAVVAAWFWFIGRTQRSLDAFAAALMVAFVSSALMVFGVVLNIRREFDSAWPNLVGLGLGSIGVGQYVRARRGPQAYALALGWVAGFVALGSIPLHLWGMDLALASYIMAFASVLLAVASLGIEIRRNSVIVPRGTESRAAGPRSRKRTLLMLCLVNLPVFIAAIIGGDLARNESILLENKASQLVVNTNWAAVFAVLSVSALISTALLVCQSKIE